MDDNTHKYIYFITNDKANKTEQYFNPDDESSELSILNSEVEKSLGTTVHVFYREHSIDKLYYISEYAILFDTEINPHSNNEYTLVKVQKLSSITPNQKLDLLKQLDSLPISENIKKEIISSSYLRNQQEKLKVLRRANNICENTDCSKNIPFIKSDNSTYLEVHHIIPISQQGPDNEQNIIALCPNCHREAHYGKDKDIFSKKFQKIVSAKSKEKTN